ncbi:unnamed protein product, partial [Closterium sp. NIES-53]
IRLELKVGRNNSKERGIVDESRKLKATTLVVGTSSRGIFGIRGRTGVGAYCMKNRPPTVSVYVVLKDKVTACREADSPPAASSTPTSPGHLLVASSAPFRHSPSMSAQHQHSDRSSTHSSSGVLEPTDGLGFDDAGGDEEAARTNGAQPPGADYPTSPTVHTAPQPSRAGTWPHDHAGATPTTPDDENAAAAAAEPASNALTATAAAAAAAAADAAVTAAAGAAAATEGLSNRSGHLEEGEPTGNPRAAAGVHG